jgi:hypothetical protein
MISCCHFIQVYDELDSEVPSINHFFCKQNLLYLKSMALMKICVLNVMCSKEERPVRDGGISEQHYHNSSSLT